jgi:hypothetical protein
MWDIRIPVSKQGEAVSSGEVRSGRYAGSFSISCILRMDVVELVSGEKKLQSASSSWLYSCEDGTGRDTWLL